MSAQNITIVGAGMSGLAAALAFARNGHEVDIVEQTGTLSEVGAGLQISPNASRILIELGLGDQLAASMICPEQISLVSGAQDHPCALREICRRSLGSALWRDASRRSSGNPP